MKLNKSDICSAWISSGVLAAIATNCRHVSPFRRCVLISFPNNQNMPIHMDLTFTINCTYHDLGFPNHSLKNAMVLMHTIKNSDPPSPPSYYRSPSDSPPSNHPTFVPHHTLLHQINIVFHSISYQLIVSMWHEFCIRFCLFLKGRPRVSYAVS